MRSTLSLLLILGIILPIGMVQAQTSPEKQHPIQREPLSSLLLEPVTGNPYPQAAETCTTARSCVALGSVLTVVGVGVAGLGVTFLTRLDSEDAENDIVAIPTAFVGGTLVVTGLISAGAGIHLLTRSRRLKRMSFNIGWEGAPRAHLRVQL